MDASRSIMEALISWPLIISLVSYSANGLDYTAVQQRLSKELLKNYDPSVPPDNKTVEINFSLIDLRVDEMNSYVVLHAWVLMTWADHRLSWEDEDEYKSLRALHLPPQAVWQPHLTLINNADKDLDDVRHKPFVAVFPHGQVLVIPQTNFHIHCYFDLRFWPFDHQTCSFLVTADDVNFLIEDKNHQINLKEYTENPGWTITEASISLDPHCCWDRNGTVQSWIKINRNSTGLAATVVMPAIALMALMLVNFWVPPRAMWRIGISLVSILFSALYLQHLVRLHPQSGNSLPLLVQFFRDSMALSLLFVGFTVIIRHMDESSEGKSPFWVYRVTTGWWGRVMCLPEQEHMNVEDSTSNEVDEENLVPKKPMQHEQNMLTLFLERIVFYLFTLFFTVYFLVFIIVFS